ncbi:hypothetical protein B0H14DRAFT_3857814, partial [Mycena olivaceomarginata]
MFDSLAWSGGVVSGAPKNNSAESRGAASPTLNPSASAAGRRTELYLDSKDTARPLRSVSHIVLFRALATIPFLDPNAKLNLPASALGPLTATKGYSRFQAGPTLYISWDRNANKRICQRVPCGACLRGGAKLSGCISANTNSLMGTHASLRRRIWLMLCGSRRKTPLCPALVMALIVKSIAISEVSTPRRDQMNRYAKLYLYHSSHTPRYCGRAAWDNERTKPKHGQQSSLGSCSRDKINIMYS